METVTSGTYDAPRQAAELYAPDGVFCGTEIFAPDDPLWGSASEVVRNTPEQIYAYYVRRVGRTVVSIELVNVRFALLSCVFVGSTPMSRS